MRGLCTLTCRWKSRPISLLCIFSDWQFLHFKHQLFTMATESWQNPEPCSDSHAGQSAGCSPQALITALRIQLTNTPTHRRAVGSTAPEERKTKNLWNVTSTGHVKHKHNQVSFQYLQANKTTAYCSNQNKKQLGWFILEHEALLSLLSPSWSPRDSAL